MVDCAWQIDVNTVLIREVHWDASNPIGTHARETEAIGSVFRLPAVAQREEEEEGKEI